MIIRIKSKRYAAPGILLLGFLWIASFAAAQAPYTGRETQNILGEVMEMSTSEGTLLQFDRFGNIAAYRFKYSGYQAEPLDSLHYLVDETRVTVTFPDQYTRLESYDPLFPGHEQNYRYDFDENRRVERAVSTDGVYTTVCSEYRYEEPGIPFPTYLKYTFTSEAGQWEQVEYYDYLEFDSVGNWTARKIRRWNRYIPAEDDEEEVEEETPEVVESAVYTYRE